MELNKYKELLEEIKKVIPDKDEALAVLQEMRKDKRQEIISKEKGMIPATDKQKEYMGNLGINFDETVTKQEASKLIDQVKKR